MQETGKKSETSGPKRCPHSEYCATPNYWKKSKATYIKEVCNTMLHKTCVHKDSLDCHLNSMSEEQKQDEIKRIKDYLKRNRVEE